MQEQDKKTVRITLSESSGETSKYIRAGNYSATVTFGEEVNLPVDVVTALSDVSETRYKQVQVNGKTKLESYEAKLLNIAEITAPIDLDENLAETGVKLPTFGK